MKNPFAKHYATETAKQETALKAGAGEAGESPHREATAQEAARKMLTEMSLYLKEIRSTQAKATYKLNHLTDLFPYADGVMSAEIKEGEMLPQDDVFMTILLWAFDAEMLNTGRELAEFARAHEWQMPPMLAVKEPAIFILTRLTEIAAENEATPELMPHDLILEIAGDYADADLHDDLGFKVHKMLGDLLSESDPAIALKHYQKSAVIKPSRNGLVRKMKDLSEQIAAAGKQEPSS